MMPWPGENISLYSSNSAVSQLSTRSCCFGEVEGIEDGFFDPGEVGAVDVVDAVERDDFVDAADVRVGALDVEQLDDVVDAADER